MSDGGLARGSLAELEAAARIVRTVVSPTPAYRWPLLEARLGTEVWVKHENHTPVGAFKLRGGLVWFDALRREDPACRGVVAATRGNHGQSVALAAARHGIAATIVVPRGNSREKNAAMRALGAQLVEHGDDFQASREHAAELAGRQGLRIVPSFDARLVHGVASYWLEFLRDAPELDTVFVPVGLGSGACAAIVARAALGRARARLRIVGVVSSHAPAYARSFAAGVPVEAPAHTRLADGVACRVPDPAALAILLRGLDDVVEVDDDEVAQAMRAYFTDTHNVAEGAGAAPLAAALAGRDRLRGQRVGLVLTGGNVDREVFAAVLGGDTPAA